MKSSGLLSNSTFQMDLVAEICINSVAPCLTTPNSSGQHPSGLAMSKLESLTGWPGLSSKIALGFSHFVEKSS